MSRFASSSNRELAADAVVGDGNGNGDGNTKPDFDRADFGADGSVIGIHGVTIDITRRRRAEELAREGGYDGFTTSMLVSTHQDHEAIRRAGEAAARKHGVEFVYRDFRPAVMEGVRASREMGLYRQQYCGCIYSEKERYFKD